MNDNKHKSTVKLLSTLKGWSLLALSQIIAMSGTKRAIVALVVVFIVDFITGCMASWVEHKANPTPVSAYFIQSSKIRKSGIKAIGYMSFILLSWLFMVLYFDKKVKLPGSSLEFTIQQLIIGVCIATEGWSNIENLKRCGFDIIGNITVAAKSLWKVFYTIKTGKGESNN